MTDELLLYMYVINFCMFGDIQLPLYRFTFASTPIKGRCYMTAIKGLVCLAETACNRFLQLLIFV